MDTDTCYTSMNLKNMINGKKQDAGDHTLYDPIYTKHLKPNLQRQIRAWNRRQDPRLTVNRYSGSNQGDENVPKLFIVMVAQLGKFTKNH